jgi:hypothetical protein
MLFDVAQIRLPDAIFCLAAHLLWLWSEASFF